MIIVDSFTLMWTTLAIAGLGVVAYAHPRIPLELTSVGILASLLILFHIAPIEGPVESQNFNSASLLRGFGNPAIITVLALLIVGHGMVRTGALEIISQIIYHANSPTEI